MQKDGATLQFATQKELLDAIKALQAMFIHSVYCLPKLNLLEFKTESDAERAKKILNEQKESENDLHQMG